MPVLFTPRMRAARVTIESGVVLVTAGLAVSAGAGGRQFLSLREKGGQVVRPATLVSLPSQPGRSRSRVE